MAILSITNNARGNNAPSQIGKRTIIIEYNEEYVFSSNDFTTLTVPQYQDPEGDDMNALKILSLPSSGFLTNNGNTVNLNDEISKFEIDVGFLKYTPDPSLTTSHVVNFQFDISDQGSNSMSGLPDGLVEITVSDQVNLPPSAVGNYTVQVGWGIAVVLTRDMFTTLTTPQYSDPEGDAPSKLKITSLPVNGSLTFNGNPVYVGQEIDFSDIDNDLLIFTPDPTITDSNTIAIDFAISDTGSQNFTF